MRYRTSEKYSVSEKQVYEETPFCQKGGILKKKLENVHEIVKIWTSRAENRFKWTHEL